MNTKDFADWRREFGMTRRATAELLRISMDKVKDYSTGMRELPYTVELATRIYEAYIERNHDKLFAAVNEFMEPVVQAEKDLRAKAEAIQDKAINQRGNNQ